METLLRYIVSGTDRVTLEQLQPAVQTELTEQGQTTMPTIAEIWKQEGIEIGRGEGVQIGRGEGELIGRIRAWQEVLGVDVASVETLSSRTNDELQQLAAELGRQVKALTDR